MALNKRRISTKKMTRPILSGIFRVVCRHCKRSPGLSHSARLAAWLVRAGAEVNCVIDGDGDTPLHVLRDRDTCRLLVERGADVHAPNTRGHTPLHVAARRGAADTAQLLLDHGAAAAARDCGGATPLHHCGDRDTCALLLAAGAELEAADVEGRTPLHSAAWRGQLEVARVLLEAGARVNAANDRGQRPLHLATMRGWRGLVVVLLQRGAEVAARDSCGDTALNDCPDSAVCGLLLERGAREVTNHLGGSTLQLAVYMGHQDTARVLLQHREMDRQPTES